MKVLKGALLLTVALIFYSCDVYEIEEETKTEYKFIEKGNGKVPGPDDIMLVQMENVMGDSVLMRTVTKDGLSMTTEQGPPMITSILKMCAEGDSVHIRMSLEEYAVATRTPWRRTRDSLETVIMKMRITKVVNRKEYVAKKKAAAMEHAEEQSKLDQEIIKKFVSDNNLNARMTDEGLHYVIDKSGTGEKPKSGEWVTVDYTLRLIDGTFIESSKEEISRQNGKFSRTRRYSPHKFVLGTKAVIQGWDLGIGLISEGGKATLLIPSNLGYGPSPEDGSIPPDAVLIFEVELVEIGI